VLHNARAWSNLTKTDTQNLQRTQLKYLKRIFHAPSSTSNPLTFLETGTLPIEYEIHIRQLGFLHHIITLHKSDPVRQQYEQQLLYPAPNWANEVLQLRKTYNLAQSDVEIADIPKETWKNEVKKKVRDVALEDLSNKANEQKKSQNLLPYTELSCQEYMTTLSPKFARKIFHIRTRTVDIRSIRKYTYGDNVSCRLCQNEDETIEHITNKCPNIGRSTQINIYTTNCNCLKEMAKRFVEFDKKIEEMENGGME
jgi:hypothetical protein